MSADPTSPAALFGGTWEQIKDKFILAAGDTYAVGSTGGEEKHLLTKDELPKTRGEFAVNSVGNTQGIFNETYGVFSISQFSEGAFVPNNKVESTTCGRKILFSLGSDIPHNNMPPYITKYVWQRTA